MGLRRWCVLVGFGGEDQDPFSTHIFFLVLSSSGV